MTNLRRQIPDISPSCNLSHAEFEKGAILNINKPEGWTSFDVVRKVRNSVRVKKVGHAGTLDPFATGVLLVCTGKATKRVDELMAFEKEYVAQVELGKETDTFDCTGTVVAEHDTAALSSHAVVTVCKQFEGEIWQTPPMYSAVKVNGERLYRLARKGMTVDRPPRKVTVHRMVILDVELPMVTLKITCSKGTYIRSIAHDIGARLNSGGHLTALTRTRVGPYTLQDARPLAEFVQKNTNVLNTVDK
ncbi:MAG: tRNA pseudouridine(55) synthase TruB [bacterium]